MGEKNYKREDLAEKLLREERGYALSPDFRRNVMAQVAKLPAPALIPQRSRLSPGLLLGGAAGLLALGGAALLLLPGGGVLDGLALELAARNLSLSWGSSSVSLDLLTAAALGAGLALLGGFSAAASRLRLISG